MAETYYGLPRPDVMALVPAEARSILDCGCGEGVLGGRLRAPGRTVTGIELHDAAAALAASRLDRVLVGGLEERLRELEGESFDCIVCADILEHLPDPWSTVRRLAERLATGGTLVCSVPNVRHLGILVDLLVRGRWRYTESGVLDRTHLRFFTRIELLALLEQAGLHVERVTANQERFGGALKLAAFVVSRVSPELTTAQWLARARKPG